MLKLIDRWTRMRICMHVVIQPKGVAKTSYRHHATNGSCGCNSNIGAIGAKLMHQYAWGVVGLVEELENRMKSCKIPKKKMKNRKIVENGMKNVRFHERHKFSSECMKFSIKIGTSFMQRVGGKLQFIQFVLLNVILMGQGFMGGEP